MSLPFERRVKPSDGRRKLQARATAAAQARAAAAAIIAKPSDSDAEPSDDQSELDTPVIRSKEEADQAGDEAPDAEADDDKEDTNSGDDVQPKLA